MRILFAAATLFSIVGAVVFGGALAWNSSATISSSAAIGVLDFEAIYVASPGALLGPDGATTTVGVIDLENLGNFNLGWDSGVVIPVSLDASHASCDVANFTGQVVPIGQIAAVQGIAPGVLLASAARVQITVRTGAPVACAGGILTFDVVVTLKTLSNAP